MGTRSAPEPDLHPLCCEDALSEALAYQLRQQSPCGRLISMVQELGRADWLVVRPGQRRTLTDLLQAAVTAQAWGVVVDTANREAAESWVSCQSAHLAVTALPGLAQRAGILASAFYGRPSERLAVTAITGTNGKTTVSQALARSLAWIGRSAVSIGTLGIHRFERIADERAHVQTLAEPGLTSLDAVSLQRRLADCVAEGIHEVVLEASSIGLAQGRLAGCRFKDVALTSFSQDHLDAHQTMDAYARAKSLLFQAPGLSGSVRARPIRGQDSLPDVLRTGQDILWVRVASQEEESFPSEELTLVIGKSDQEGTPLSLRLPHQPSRASAPVCWFRPPGQHNLQNAAVVAGLLVRRGFSAEEVLACLGRFELPVGRMQQVGSATDDRPCVYIDYAHTPDALGQALAALRPIADARGGRLICVFGCGGNRDTAKRPLMAQVAANAADWLVITSDNPRFEAPQAIVQEIISGLTRVALRRTTIEEDREQAIERALELAAAADVVLIAGKGHEAGQEIAGEVRPFDDGALASDLLACWYLMPSFRHMVAQLSAAAVSNGQTYGTPLHTSADLPLVHVSIDTRTVGPGSVFVAIPGARVDGHDFLEQAFAQGAIAALVSHAPTAAQTASGQLGPCIAVTSPQAALACMAKVWRGAWRGRLAAVTGSNGKTTVKEMTAAVLRQAYGSRAVWATPGNLNNHLGVPLSILGLRPRHQVAVLEIGMNHPDEVAALADLAAPDLALLTNAQREHQEFMASVRACAEENAQSFLKVKAQGTVVVPRDPEHEPLWAEMTASRPDLRHLRFGLADDPAAGESIAYAAQCDAQIASSLPLAFTITVSAPVTHQATNDPRFTPGFTPAVSQPVHIAGLGRHLARNAAGAAALGIGLGLSIQQVEQGLAAFTPVNGRGRLHCLSGTQWLVDDSYNANPDSVLAAIDGLAAVDGLHALVLGDMGEVGDQGPAFHAEVLSAARSRGVAQVLVFGQAMSLASAQTGIGQSFSDLTTLVAALIGWMDQQRGQSPQVRQTVWVKGSRFMRLERVVQALLSRKEHHASVGLSVAG